MSCDQTRLLMPLMVYDDPATAQDVKEAFRVHLMLCPKCDREYEQTQYLFQLLRQHCVSQETPASPDQLLQIDPLTDDNCTFDLNASLSRLLGQIESHEDQERSASTLDSGRDRPLHCQRSNVPSWRKAHPYIPTALAACLFVAVPLAVLVWRWHQRPSFIDSSVGTASPSVLMVIGGRQRPMVLGEPIESGNSVVELLLENRHRVILN